MTVGRRDIQVQIDTRALEMASATDAVMSQHLIECRDRYLGLRAEMAEIKKVLIGAATGIIALLVAVLGYLVSHGGIPLAH